MSKRNIDVNWVQSLAAALAAVSSAVLLSTVGVAGTVIGAAVGSLFATVGSAVYSHYLETSKQRVAAASALARAQAAQARGRMRGAAASSAANENGTRQLMLAERDLDEAEHHLEHVEEETPKPTWRETLRGLKWKWILLVAGGVFLAAMAVILAFELLTGRAVSEFTGGTDEGKRTSLSFGQGSEAGERAPANEPGSDAPADEAPAVEPSDPAAPTADSEREGQPAEQPSEEPSQQPTEEEPSAEPTTEPTTPLPTQTPSAASPTPAP